mmetsp:Transcript_36236/g.69812  ORF Transcript_36236/g.69812 Transcript_36236/m.69812 type:complete len:489 (-) Transcript_36236:93-1559(-)|eukprot:CAMPEP_0172670884 /NCGR_PEP_ID=MMETSP1074-20121228/10562_1 /TAXON_ID=2916 /ORGANISM="Ceratium fusus, Strain PA161109" /LENGTH=488 /DNA_ID=CAMNT_0013487847 /DNA_START=92 /DNA_END=1558 /DNA_ORIENTATION=+
MPVTGAMDEEEKTMQSFVRSTMVAMLQPVAEHVREVQEQLDKLAKELSSVHGRCDENKAQLDQQQEHVVALRTCTVKVESNIDRLQSDLAQTHREKERLLEDHEATKADVAKVAGNLRTSNTVLKALQGKAEDLEADVKNLQKGSATAAKQLQEQGESAAQLREYTEGLNGKHMDLVRDVADLAKVNAGTESALCKFIHSCEQADNGLQTELQRLRDHLDSLERRLGGTQQQVIEAVDGVKQIEATLRQFKTADDGFSQMNTFQAWRDHATLSIKDLLADVERLDIALAQLQNQTSVDKESADSQFRDLEGRIKNNFNKLEKLGTGHQTHGEQLKKSELTIGRLQKGLEALGEQSDLLHADQQNLRTAHNDAINKQEVHRIALTKTQADLQHATKELQSTGKQVHVLKDGLAETNLGMTKLGGRYDSCTRNIMGMTKGLQDISKSVGQGEHGLLPPKSARRLPEISYATARISRGPSPVRSAFADETQ